MSCDRPGCKNGSRRSRTKPGTWEHCECVHEELFQGYLSDIMPMERWDKYKYLKDSVLTGLIRKNMECAICTPPEDGKFVVFYSHLKTALRSSFFKRVEDGKRPLTCRVMEAGDLTEILYDKPMGWSDKRDKLAKPDLLVIMAPSFKHFEAFFVELENLISSRSQSNTATWLVSNDFDKLKNPEFRVPTSFRQFLNRLRNDSQIVLSKSDISSSNTKTKETKSAVIDIKKGLGPSGLDDALWIPQDTKFSSIGKER